jgi:hypothetical protein
MLDDDPWEDVSSFIFNFRNIASNDNKPLTYVMYS